MLDDKYRRKGETVGMRPMTMRENSQLVDSTKTDNRQLMQ